MKTIKFKKSPIGAYGLSYAVGEIAEFEESQAIELIENGFAELVENETEKAVKTEPKEIKKAVKK
jgi:hypothetical protein